MTNKTTRIDVLEEINVAAYHRILYFTILHFFLLITHWEEEKKDILQYFSKNA